MSKKLVFKQKITVLVVAFSLLITYFVIIAISRIGETAVNLSVIPRDATIRIGDKPIKAGKVYLKPGTYTFTAEKPGFKPDSQDLTVEKEKVDLGLLPEPQSQADQAALFNNKELQAEREAIGGQNASRRGEVLQKLNPIISGLPYEERTGPFTVNYGPSKERKGGAFLEINGSTPPGRIKAIEWIRQQGYDPTDFEIRYTDYISPLITGDVTNVTH